MLLKITVNLENCNKVLKKGKLCFTNLNNIFFIVFRQLYIIRRIKYFHPFLNLDKL